MKINKQLGLKFIFLIVCVVISRCFFNLNKQNFYDYIAYPFSFGILLLVLFPSLQKVKFWGVEAVGKENDTNKVSISNSDSSNKIIIEDLK